MDHTSFGPGQTSPDDSYSSSLDFRTAAGKLPDHSMFTCTELGCSKQYSRRHKLREHISSKHRGLKPYHCHTKDCSMSFSNRADCKRHEMTHSRQKDFVCSFCQKEFIRKDSLQEHQRRHCILLHIQACNKALEGRQAMDDAKHRPHSAYSNVIETCAPISYSKDVRQTIEANKAASESNAHTVRTGMPKDDDNTQEESVRRIDAPKVEYAGPRFFDRTGIDMAIEQTNEVCENHEDGHDHRSVADPFIKYCTTGGKEGSIDPDDTETADFLLWLLDADEDGQKKGRRKGYVLGLFPCFGCLGCFPNQEQALTHCGRNSFPCKRAWDKRYSHDRVARYGDTCPICIGTIETRSTDNRTYKRIRHK